MKLFVVNKLAGKGGALNLKKIIKVNARKDIKYKVIFWDNSTKNIFSEIKKYIKKGYKSVVAAGGDGSVNAIASILNNTDAVLSIIPTGSGNGLARHLGIPIDAAKAIKNINNPRTIKIDSCTLNGKTFFCTSGIGFDAHVGEKFANSTKRGFLTYAKIAISEFYKYTPARYKIIIDDKVIKTEAFIVTFANANQWGNDFFIAPEANIQDGLVDVSIVKKANIFNFLNLTLKLRNKKILESRYVDSYRGKHIIIKSESPIKAHMDGEPVHFGNKIEIKIQQQSLRVAV